MNSNNKDTRTDDPSERVIIACYFILAFILGIVFGLALASAGFQLGSII